MKKIFLTALLAACIATVNAQFSWGPKAGVNIARLSFTSGNYKTSAQPGLYGGLFANYRLGNNMALQMEMLYSGEGTKEKSTVTSSSGTIKKGFLHIPLLFQYSIVKGIYAEAGPQIGFLLSSKETYNSNSNDIKRYYNGTDFRFPFGVGYQFEKGPVKGLGIGARYSFSLSKLNKVQVGGGDLKSHVFSLGAQYRLLSRK